MKITFIGAGSSVFTAEIIKDILLIPNLEDGIFALIDIDQKRLDLAKDWANAMITRLGKKWKVLASTDREELLEGSNYVINSIEVFGLENVGSDYDIPLKYGVDQCIGDTIGPGGLFKALRTIPEWIKIVKDVKRLAPRATIMNYTNPMSLSVLAAARTSDIPIIGLCHSIQGSSRQLAEYIGIDYEKMNWRAAGINHNAWFTILEDENGNSLYPKLKEMIQNDKELFSKDPVRFETMKHLGYFVTESSGHFSEYVPYFRKRKDLIEKYCGEGYLGESGMYRKNWPQWREEGRMELDNFLKDKDKELERGYEYASYIIEAIEFNKPSVVYGNVPNTGLIDNLPRDGVVEVACLVDNKGIQPTHFGRLPSHLASLNFQHMMFHDQVVQAIRKEDRELAIRALFCDPLTAAVCSLQEMRDMFEEMVEAESKYLPEFLKK